MEKDYHLMAEQLIKNNKDSQMGRGKSHQKNFF